MEGREGEKREGRVKRGNGRNEGDMREERGRGKGEERKGQEQPRPRFVAAVLFLALTKDHWTNNNNK